MTPARNTINYLKRCQSAREAGYPVYLKTDPAWLVNMAINRRAGWPESQFLFAGCMPVEGKYPKRADENLRQFADHINTPRLIVRGEQVPMRYRQKLAHRIYLDNPL
jgi:hypothetical protein